MKVVCHFVNVDGVRILLAGGADTLLLFSRNELIWPSHPELALVQASSTYTVTGIQQHPPLGLPAQFNTIWYHPPHQHFWHHLATSSTIQDSHWWGFWGGINWGIMVVVMRVMCGPSGLRGVVGVGYQGMVELGIKGATGFSGAGDFCWWTSNFEQASTCTHVCACTHPALIQNP